MAVYFPRWVKPSVILDRHILVMYLVIIDGLLKEKRWAELAEIPPDEKFQAVVSEYVGAYLNDGVMPPEEIASAVLNIADDFLAGREPVLKAGDYIAIQNFIRR